MAPHPPDLLGYRTGYDDAEGCYVAVWTDSALPAAAVAAGCAPILRAATEDELRQAAVHNRVLIWKWRAAYRAAIHQAATRFRTGDPA